MGRVLRTDICTVGLPRPLEANTKMGEIHPFSVPVLTNKCAAGQYRLQLARKQLLQARRAGAGWGWQQAGCWGTHTFCLGLVSMGQGVWGLEYQAGGVGWQEWECGVM